MLMVFRIFLIYYCLALSVCNVEKATEVPEQVTYSSRPKSSKSEYSAEDIGSYSRGALYAPSAVITNHGHETGILQNLGT